MYDGGPIGTRLRGEPGALLPDELPAPRSKRGRSAATLSEALVLTAAAAVLPGLAHLRTGRFRAGLVMLVSYLTALTGAAIAVTRHRETLLELAVQPDWLLAFMLAAVAAALTWVVLLIHSYAVLRPARLRPLEQLVGGTAVAVMCLLVVVPPLTAARYGGLQRELLREVFSPDPAPAAAAVVADGDMAGGDAVDGVLAGGAPAGTQPGPGFAGRRLNILLIGGDADFQGPGFRTGSTTLASVDTRTGDTVLLGLERSLRHVPVFSGRYEVPFDGNQPLSAVYAYGLAHPWLLGEHVPDPGAELLKQTVAHILGQPVGYYGMIGTRGFRELVDAMGGLRLCPDRAVPVPREQVPSGVIRPGCRRLGGRQALWYGQSSTGGDDGRVSRRRCLLWAIARQASALTVLTRFQRLAPVFERSVRTDLPQGMLPGLIGLAAKVRTARIMSVQFVPPAVVPAEPDYPRIRRLTALAIEESRRPQPDPAVVHPLSRACG